MATATKTKQLTEAEIETIISELNPKELARLDRWTRSAIDKKGLVGVRDESKTFEKFKHGVIQDIYGAGMTIREIEDNDDDTGALKKDKWE